MKRIIYSLMLVMLLISGADAKAEKKEKRADGLYATLETNKGPIVVSLFYQELPLTVGNFVALAEGKRKTNLDEKYRKQPLYNGVTFGRKLPNFMIASENDRIKKQDEKGIGYTLPYERNDSLQMLPNTLSITSQTGENNGSQLVITFQQHPFFMGANLAVGQIVEGLAIAQELAEGDKIEQVQIVRIGKSAKKFKGEKEVIEGLARFQQQEEEYKAKEEQRLIQQLESLKEADDEAYRYFAEQKLKGLEESERLSSGVRIKKWRTSNEPLPKKGQAIWVNYTAYLADGTLVDSSSDKSEATRFILGNGEVIKGWDEAFQHIRLGEKATLFIPSSLAYGRDGAGTVPPYTTLIFDVSLTEIEEK